MFFDRSSEIIWYLIDKITSLGKFILTYCFFNPLEKTRLNHTSNNNIK